MKQLKSLLLKNKFLILFLAIIWGFALALWVKGTPLGTPLFGVDLPSSEVLPGDRINLTPADGAIYKLAMCESGLNPNAVNWHDGGSPSFGLFQWKKSSFLHYNDKYKILPDLEDGEVMNIIYDPEAQIKLTKAVLSEPGGNNNWKNCYRKISRI